MKILIVVFVMVIVFILVSIDSQITKHQIQKGISKNIWIGVRMKENNPRKVTYREIFSHAIDNPTVRNCYQYVLSVYITEEQAVKSLALILLEQNKALNDKLLGIYQTSTIKCIIEENPTPQKDGDK